MSIMKTLSNIQRKYLTIFPPNYSWFMQYMENDNTNINIIEFPLGMIFLPYT